MVVDAAMATTATHGEASHLHTPSVDGYESASDRSTANEHSSVAVSPPVLDRPDAAEEAAAASQATKSTVVTAVLPRAHSDDSTRPVGLESSVESMEAWSTRAGDDVKAPAQRIQAGGRRLSGSHRLTVLAQPLRPLPQKPASPRDVRLDAAVLPAVTLELFTGMKHSSSTHQLAPSPHQATFKQLAMRTRANPGKQRSKSTAPTPLSVEGGTPVNDSDVGLAAHLDKLLQGAIQRTKDLEAEQGSTQFELRTVPLQAKHLLDEHAGLVFHYNHPTTPALPAAAAAAAMGGMDAADMDIFKEMGGVHMDVLPLSPEAQVQAQQQRGRSRNQRLQRRLEHMYVYPHLTAEERAIVEQYQLEQHHRTMLQQHAGGMHRTANSTLPSSGQQQSLNDCRDPQSEASVQSPSRLSQTDGHKARGSIYLPLPLASPSIYSPAAAARSDGEDSRQSGADAVGTVVLASPAGTSLQLSPKRRAHYFEGSQPSILKPAQTPTGELDSSFVALRTPLANSAAHFFKRQTAGASTTTGSLSTSRLLTGRSRVSRASQQHGASKHTQHQPQQGKPSMRAKFCDRLQDAKRLRTMHDYMFRNELLSSGLHNPFQDLSFDELQRMAEAELEAKRSKIARHRQTASKRRRLVSTPLSRPNLAVSLGALEATVHTLNAPVTSKLRPATPADTWQTRVDNRSFALPAAAVSPVSVGAATGRYTVATDVSNDGDSVRSDEPPSYTTRLATPLLERRLPAIPAANMSLPCSQTHGKRRHPETPPHFPSKWTVGDTPCGLKHDLVVPSDGRDHAAQVVDLGLRTTSHEYVRVPQRNHHAELWRSTTHLRPSTGASTNMMLPPHSTKHSSRIPSLPIAAKQLFDFQHTPSTYADYSRRPQSRVARNPSVDASTSDDKEDDVEILHVHSVRPLGKVRRDPSGHLSVEAALGQACEESADIPSAAIASEKPEVPVADGLRRSRILVARAYNAHARRRLESTTVQPSESPRTQRPLRGRAGDAGPIEGSSTPRSPTRAGLHRSQLSPRLLGDIKALLNANAAASPGLAPPVNITLDDTTTETLHRLAGLLGMEDVPLEELVAEICALESSSDEELEVQPATGQPGKSSLSLDSDPRSLSVSTHDPSAEAEALFNVVQSSLDNTRPLVPRTPTHGCEEPSSPTQCAIGQQPGAEDGGDPRPATINPHDAEARFAGDGVDNGEGSLEHGADFSTFTDSLDYVTGPALADIKPAPHPVSLRSGVSVARDPLWGSSSVAALVSNSMRSLSNSAACNGTAQQHTPRQRRLRPDRRRRPDHNPRNPPIDDTEISIMGRVALAAHDLSTSHSASCTDHDLWKPIAPPTDPLPGVIDGEHSRTGAAVATDNVSGSAMEKYAKSLMTKSSNTFQRASKRSSTALPALGRSTRRPEETSSNKRPFVGPLKAVIEALT